MSKNTKTTQVLSTAVNESFNKKNAGKSDVAFLIKQKSFVYTGKSVYHDLDSLNLWLNVTCVYVGNLFKTAENTNTTHIP